MATLFRRKFKLRHFLFGALIIIIFSIIVDFIRITNYEVVNPKPKEKFRTEQDQVYFDLVNETGEIDWSRLDNTLKFIDNQIDCADFRYVNLLRILYEFGDQIPESTMRKVENTILGFKYWWDKPGENSACYWSENHQILFASAEYLTGQLYPDNVFINDGLSGKQHMTKARKRILDWLEMRWNYGFTEYYSSVYYKEDIGGMINLIDYAKDPEIVEKTKIIMDLLMYDVASQTVNTMFISASGRAYQGNRKGGSGATLGGITDYYWGSGKKIKPGIMYGMMTTENYKLPAVISEIAKDSNNVVIKQSNGLDISELKEEGYFGTDDRSLMMQFGMEAFSNPEIVRNSLSFVRDKEMFSNEFLKDFSILDFTFLRLLHLEPAIVRIINPQSNGVAIQRGNTYTYRTKNYSLYSVQNHHPGTYGDQQHVAGMNIGNSFSIFHTHPAVEEDIEIHSPSYWVGYGHLPHVVQDENISLAIYNIPVKKGLMETALLNYTHAYFPKDLFDTAFVYENYAMGKKGDTFCAYICGNPLAFKEYKTDNLIQQGKQVSWIIEAGSISEDGSFDEFCQRILANEMNFDSSNLVLNYFSRDKEYQLEFGGDFLINNNFINLEYERYDSPYIKANKKDKTLSFNFNGETLYLDFYNLGRIYSH